MLGLLGVAICVRVALGGDAHVVAVPVAARALPAGAVIEARDIRSVSFPAEAVPAGALNDPVGRTLAGPVQPGEALTTTRMIGRSLLIGQPAGVVAVAVRPVDAGAAMVQAGDRVDVLAADAAGGHEVASVGAESGQAQRVAAAALVLAAGSRSGGDAADGGAGLMGLDVQTDGSGGWGGSGPVLVLAVDSRTAARLAAAQVGGMLSIALLRE